MRKCPFDRALAAPRHRRHDPMRDVLAPNSAVEAAQLHKDVTLIVLDAVTTAGMHDLVVLDVLLPMVVEAAVCARGEG